MLWRPPCGRFSGADSVAGEEERGPGTEGLGRTLGSRSTALPPCLVRSCCRLRGGRAVSLGTRGLFAEKRRVYASFEFVTSHASSPSGALVPVSKLVRPVNFTPQNREAQCPLTPCDMCSSPQIEGRTQLESSSLPTHLSSGLKRL